MKAREKQPGHDSKDSYKRQESCTYLPTDVAKTVKHLSATLQYGREGQTMTAMTKQAGQDRNEFEDTYRIIRDENLDMKTRGWENFWYGIFGPCR